MRSMYLRLVGATLPVSQDQKPMVVVLDERDVEIAVKFVAERGRLNGGKKVWGVLYIH